ncbi:glyoxalase [Streptomyces termitum]|uniref:Uncharacterized protein n=1 Tax=Streptomyces termitum TaxID=67368 RepID=A0A918SYH2_9ACTN|nr:glyoxalase [Streptomyces termitum]GHA77303.1 hypothetical protein GCM10010305_20240 [Streptomyces termitum]
MLTSFCPVIRTSRMDASRAFCGRPLDLAATRTTPWRTALGRPVLTLLDHTHPVLPAAPHGAVRAVRLTPAVGDGPETGERLAAHRVVGHPDRRGTAGPSGRAEPAPGP